jgi:hypothetical protein
MYFKQEKGSNPMSKRDDLENLGGSKDVSDADQTEVVDTKKYNPVLVLECNSEGQFRWTPLGDINSAIAACAAIDLMGTIDAVLKKRNISQDAEGVYEVTPDFLDKLAKKNASLRRN